jgi:hypothetical protein
MPPPWHIYQSRMANHHMKIFFGTPSPITLETCVSFGRIASVTYEQALENKYRPRAFKCYLVGYASNNSTHTDKVFKYEPGKSGEIIVTRSVRWPHWDHPNKEELNKDQNSLLEGAIDKFILDNKMCSKKFTNPSNHQNKSIYSDLRRKTPLEKGSPSN